MTVREQVSCGLKIHLNPMNKRERCYMKIFLILITLFLLSCSKVQIGDYEWDPKTAMMRATFGVSK